MEEGARNDAPVNEQFNEENINTYALKLKFVDGKRPKFYWLGTKEQLVKFVTLVFKTSVSEKPDIVWSEDTKHNMSSFKYNNLVFKYYATTCTLHTQGQKEKDAKEKLFGLLTTVTEAEQEEDGGDNDTERIRGDDDLSEVTWVCDSMATTMNTNETANQQLMDELITLKQEFHKLKSVVESIMSKENMQISQNHTFIDSSPVKEVETLRRQLLDVNSSNQCLSVKVTELEKEKASLLTVIRLLREDETASPKPVGLNLTTKASTSNDESSNRATI